MRLIPCARAMLRTDQGVALERMFTAWAEWPFDANPLFSNGVYGVRAVFCA